MAHKFAEIRKILFILVGGNLLAQIINAVFIPISTRLYEPEDFKHLSIFISVLMIVSTVGGLRFDAAIVKSESRDDADGLLLLALGSACLIGGLTLLALIGIKVSGIYELDYYFWLLPFLIVAIVIYNSFCQISNINSKFNKLARSRVSQAALGNTTLALWGWLVGTSFGLFLGYSLMYCAGVFILYSKVKLHKIPTLKKIFFKYIDYPKHSVTETIADVTGYQLPIALIGIYITTNLAGYLFIAIKVMNLPITILARALSSIYVVKIRKEREAFSLDKSIILCLSIGLLALCSCSIVFYQFSGIILGKGWEGFGNILFLLIPWFAMQFVTIVFNPIFYIFSAERFISRLQLISNVIRVVLFILALVVDKGNIVLYLALINFLFYVTWLIGIRVVFNRVKSLSKGQSAV